MKILAFAGSSSSKSINKRLVEYALKNFPEADSSVLDLRDYEMPTFSVDREAEGFPSEAQQFLNAVAQCDAIVCSMAEHNRNFTAAFKNLFDWCSRINLKVFNNKKMLLMSTSPGVHGGGNALKLAQDIFPSFGAEIVETFSLPNFYQNFDKEEGIVITELREEFNNKINRFKKVIFY